MNTTQEETKTRWEQLLEAYEELSCTIGPMQGLMDMDNTSDTTKAVLTYFMALTDFQRCSINYLAERLTKVEELSQETKRLLYNVHSITSGLKEELHETPIVLNIKAPKEHGYIYVLKADNGLYKIGRSKTPTERIRSLETKLPYELETVLILESGNYIQLELDLHQHFSNKRKQGEWFILGPEDIEYIRSLADGNSQN